MSDQIETIARAFAATIREASNELDIENSQTVGTLVLEINTKNARPDYAGCCATHDFFDANMGMLAAFEDVTGREPATISETATDAEKSADADLWNAAWTMAKEAGFWIDES
jgi:hypothetical protein